MLGPKGLAFDNDDILETNDDEDLKNDPISQMDMQVRSWVIFWGFGYCILTFYQQSHLVSFFKECGARNTGNFSAVVEKLTPEETMVVRQMLA
jgi:importin-9